jgi:hypothetical protein
MTVSSGLADAAGTPASDVPATVAAWAAAVAAILPFFRRTRRVRELTPAPNEA